jgi:hypothetical protein
VGQIGKKLPAPLLGVFERRGHPVERGVETGELRPEPAGRYPSAVVPGGDVGSRDGHLADWSGQAAGDEPAHGQ